MNLSPLSKAASKLIRKLASKKHREESGLFIAEGEKVVNDLSAGGLKIKFLVVSTETDLTKYPTSVPLFSCDEAEMNALSSLSTPPGILGVFHQPGSDADSVLRQSSKLLIADGIKDPGNLGTLIRTAHWFGLDAVVALNGCADLFNPKTVQSTMGSLGRIPVIYPETQKFLSAVSGRIPLIGADLKGKSLADVNPLDTFAVVIGSESHGISIEIKRAADQFIFIPPKNPKNHPESLNAAVSAGIILSRLAG